MEPGSDHASERNKPRLLMASFGDDSPARSVEAMRQHMNAVRKFEEHLEENGLQKPLGEILDDLDMCIRLDRNHPDDGTESNIEDIDLDQCPCPALEAKRENERKVAAGFYTAKDVELEQETRETRVHPYQPASSAVKNEHPDYPEGREKILTERFGEPEELGGHRHPPRKEDIERVIELQRPQWFRNESDFIRLADGCEEMKDVHETYYAGWREEDFRQVLGALQECSKEG
jgi:hypothetical protein